MFPIGEKQLSQDAYYKALSEAHSGFYPFGENGIWHGGIHIDKFVLDKVKSDDKLRCMANGEVIAYRINDVYPKIVYHDNVELKTPYKEQQKVAYFSTGFTLVRHLLQMPKIANSTDTPHKGYVKLTSVLSSTFEPGKLDKIVVLKAPMPIKKGDFIGYLGHNVSQSERF
ncbi:hypothetical protein GQ589_11295, partial [Gilliamella sp. Pas-s27]